MASEEPSYDKAKAKGQEGESKPQQIRFILSSINLRALENITSRLLKSAQGEKLQTIGPVRYPTRVLRLTTRKSPCGNGTATFDRWEMRIHKRIVTLICPAEYIKKVTDFAIDPGVEVEVHLSDI